MYHKLKGFALIFIIFLQIETIKSPAIENQDYFKNLVFNQSEIVKSENRTLFSRADLIEITKKAFTKAKSKIISLIEENNDKNNEEFSDEDGSGVNSVDENSSAENIEIVDEYVLNYLSNNNQDCMMAGMKNEIMWWAHGNGSLTVKSVKRSLRESVKYFVDLSHRQRTTDEFLEAKVKNQKSRKIGKIIGLSAAYDGLKQVPFRTLSLVKTKLEYLMLQGNNFSSYIKNGDSTRNEKGIAWATFPKLEALKELDISRCEIQYISAQAFKNLTNLTHLYLSHNKISRVPSQAFSKVRNLIYLDLSNQNALDLDFTIPIPSFEQIVNMLVGVRIEQNAFRYLSKLEYLDMSFTKLTRSSVVAFNFLRPKLQYLSLCFTSFPSIGISLFKNTHLKGLDLSGNTYAAFTIVEETFATVSKTLRFLFFKQANIKELDWIRKLRNLAVVDLSNNNINTASLDVFSSLENLEILDLSSNNLGNWYNRILATNKRLKVLNLSSNNINILTSEMLKDFQELSYLGIGDNDFVCDCVLRDFVDIAVANNKKEDCLQNVIDSAQDLIHENINSSQGPTFFPNINHLKNFENFGYKTALTKYMPRIRKSYTGIRERMNKHHIFNLKIIKDLYSSITENYSCPNTNQIILYDKINGSSLKFQLLDYEDIHYWCFNETERLNFFELNCEPRSFNDTTIENIHHFTKIVTITVSVLVFLVLATLVVYLKRWHIYYYWSSLKSAALLSVAAKENCERFSDLTAFDSNSVYDLFISYCQNDREWILNELIPNVEMTGDLSICMHERDFEVGLPILDNIVSCMDRSRCLMLVISSNFLLSHWCQFEMRLAQHRMFEANKEHLILVFLEDVPKYKRPKTLQYLMEVKTYIKWPSNKAKVEEKKHFWKRLRKSIQNKCAVETPKW